MMGWFRKKPKPMTREEKRMYVEDNSPFGFSFSSRDIADVVLTEAPPPVTAVQKEMEQAYFRGIRNLTQTLHEMSDCEYCGSLFVPGNYGTCSKCGAPRKRR